MSSKTNVYEYTAVPSIGSTVKMIFAEKLKIHDVSLAATGPGGRVTQGRPGFAPGGG